MQIDCKFFSMIIAKIIVDTRRKTKNNYPVKIRVFDNKNPHRYISLKKYQDSKQLIRDAFIKQREYQLEKELEYINVNNLNLEKAINIIKFGIPKSLSIEEEIHILENKLALLRAKIKQYDFFDYAAEFIDQKKKRNESTYRFEKTITSFQSFLGSNELDINAISHAILNEYFTFCKSKGLTYSTFSTYFNTLRTIFYAAQNTEEIFVKQSNPFHNHTFFNYDTKIEKSLTLEDMILLYQNRNLDYSWTSNYKEEYRKAIHLVLFQFAIGGHDFAELSQLKWNNLKDDRIKFYRFKNISKGGGELVNNYLSEFCKQVIEEFGTTSSEYVFSFIPSARNQNSAYTAARRKQLHYLTRIQKTLNLSNKLRTKTVRYTFRTIAGNLLINQMIIESIMGHKDNSISMGYQGSIPYEIQDIEHKKVLDLIFVDN